MQKRGVYDQNPDRKGKIRTRESRVGATPQFLVDGTGGLRLRGRRTVPRLRYQAGATLTQTNVAHLIDERPVADFQSLRGLAAVPTMRSESLKDDTALPVAY